MEQLRAQSPSEESKECDGPSFHEIPRGCRTISKLLDVREVMERGFAGLPVNSAPLPRESDERESEMRRRLKVFIGDVTDEQFDKLAEYCSEDHLRMPHDLKIKSKKPFANPLKFSSRNEDKVPDEAMLCTNRRLRQRMLRDPEYKYSRYLKYRRDKTSASQTYATQLQPIDSADDLEPGKTLIYRVRMYKPFITINNMYLVDKKASTPKRYPLFVQEILMLGHHTLDMLRDRIMCINDFGTRQDCSDNLVLAEELYDAKKMYPSGFLFINNVFYVDMRVPGSIDYSEPIRRWAEQKGIGHFQHYSIEGVRFDSLKLRLGHPEVYMHQGNCEHLFTVSEVRLLRPGESCSSASYPHTTGILPSKSVNCMTCGNFVCKWIVVGYTRLTFDPAHLCDTCFKQYNYIGDKKIGEFKAYPLYDKAV